MAVRTLESAMRLAADDIGHLLSRGYPRTGVIRFASDHYRLVNRSLPDMGIPTANGSESIMHNPTYTLSRIWL